MGKDICLFERKELKYLISRSQWDNLLPSIGRYIQRDNYHKYTICNVYMDSPDYRFIRKSLERPVYKEKLRLRSYGQIGMQEGVFLELKKKYKGIVYKRRTRMSHEDALKFLSGEGKANGQIEREILYFLNQNKGIAPAMYISYEREAWRGRADGDLRITLDRNILWREDNPNLSSRPSGNSLLHEDERLMEIKCVGSMPLWLTDALSRNRIYKTSFSKFGKAYGRRLSADKAKRAC